MKKSICCFFVLCFIFFFSGCNQPSDISEPEDGAPSSTITAPNTETTPFVEIDGLKLTLDEIKEQVAKTFNNHLYYHGNDPQSAYLLSNSDLVVGKSIQYDLYVEKDVTNGEEKRIDSPMVMLVIKNIDHPTSTAEKRQRYHYSKCCFFKIKEFF